MALSQDLKVGIHLTDNRSSLFVWSSELIWESASHKEGKQSLNSDTWNPMGDAKPKRRGKFLSFPTAWNSKTFPSSAWIQPGVPPGRIRVVMVSSHFFLCVFLLSQNKTPKNYIL